MVRNAMSATEFYILQYLWTRETPATFSEIMVHFNEEEKKAWKKQTVNTFLSRLAQKGFLNIDKSPHDTTLFELESFKNAIAAGTSNLKIKFASQMWATRPRLGSIFEKLLHRKTFWLPAACFLIRNIIYFMVI